MSTVTSRPFPDSNTRLNGTPLLLGTITATTAKDNADTAVVFNDASPGLAGKLIMLQTDSACYVKCSTAAASAATSANGILLAAYERVVIWLGESYGWVSVLPVSGTSVVKVWELI